MEFVGFKVTREYYVNDGGAQIGILVRTIYFRYLEKLGEVIEIPDESYPGDYLIPIAEKLIDKYGNKLKNLAEVERDNIIRSFYIFFLDLHYTLRLSEQCVS